MLVASCPCRPCHVNHRRGMFNPTSQIRALIIEPGPRHSPISAYFQVTNVLRNQSCEWEVVVYESDDLAPSIPMICREETIKITQKDLEVMIDLRSATAEKCFWISTICIFQDDGRVELEQQVALMRYIYRKAVSVNILLDTERASTVGPILNTASYWCECDTESAKELPVEFSPEFEIEFAIESETDSESTESLHSLESLFKMKFPKLTWNHPFQEVVTSTWFTRLWGLQEAVFARTLIVHVGKYAIPWDDFVNTVVRFLSQIPARQVYRKTFDDCYRAAQKMKYKTEVVKGLFTINIIHQLRQWLKTSIVPITPSELLYMTTKYHVDHSCDVVYGISSFLDIKIPAGTMVVPPINYGLSATEVFKNFTEWTIQNEGTLDILAQQCHEVRRVMISPGWISMGNHQIGVGLLSYTPFFTRLGLSNALRPTQPPICHQVAPSKLVVRGFILDEFNAEQPHPASWEYGRKLTAECLALWLSRASLNTPATNVIMLGRHRITQGVLARLLARTWQQYPFFSHLWRDGRLPDHVPYRKKFIPGRWAYLTRRGLLAVTVAYLDTRRHTLKLCYLNGGRGLFVLQELRAVRPKARPTYRLITGDCFVEGYNDGNGYNIARDMDFKELDICLV